MKDDVIYTAGLFDGEGTITLSREKASSEFRRPVVSVTSTTYELLNFLRVEFGGYICQHTRRSEKHSQAWSWRTVSNGALQFLAQIYPFLKEPEKKRRTALILRSYKMITPRNGKYTNKQREAKVKFEQSFFHPSKSSKLRRRLL